MPAEFLPWNVAHPKVRKTYVKLHKSTAGSKLKEEIDKWLGLAEEHLNTL